MGSTRIRTKNWLCGPWALVVTVVISSGVQVGRGRAAGGGGGLGASALVLAELPEFVLLESRCPHLYLAQEEQRAAV